MVCCGVTQCGYAINAFLIPRGRHIGLMFSLFQCNHHPLWRMVVCKDPKLSHAVLCPPQISNEDTET